MCGLEEIDFDKFKLFMDELFFKSIVLGSLKVEFNVNLFVFCWDEDDYEICVVLVLVCI